MQNVMNSRRVGARSGTRPHLYFVVIVSAILICLLPNKLLPFLLPPALFLFLIRTKGSNLERLLVILTVFLLDVFLNTVVNPGFRLVNAVISLGTFSALYLLFLDFGNVRRRIDLERLSRFLFRVVLFEAVLGIIQGVYGFFATGSFAGSTGDRVAGTVKPSLYGDANFSNGIFSIIMTSLLILLLPYILRERRRIFLSALPVLAILLGSVMHVIIYAGLALVFSALVLTRFRLLLRGRFLLVTALVTVTMLVTIGQNLTLIQTYLERAGDTSSSPRTAIIERVRTDVMPPGSLQMVIGNGPGQFVSRAGLISAGHYFGGFNNPIPLPLIETGLTRLQERYLYDLWAWAANTPWFGSTDVPYFSWLAIYTEHGLLGVLVCLVALAFLIRSALRHRSVPGRVAQVSFILFLAMLGFSENYFELPQAILPGILLLGLLGRGEAEG